MNRKNRDLLIAALETPPDEGGYVKYRGSLVIEGHNGDSDRFCCLGVACDIFDLWETDGYSQGGFLSPKQLKQIGMTKSEQQKLMDVNDEHFTFGPVIDLLKTMKVTT